jgi:hypothetical protein
MSESATVRRVWSPDRVLAVALADGERAYGDLSHYRLSMTLEPDGWHVDYEPKGEFVVGGGPHYVIDAETGEILSKRYEQ